MTEIEFCPIFHTTGITAHEDLLKAIGKMPKNQTVFFEIDRATLEELRKDLHLGNLDLIRARQKFLSVYDMLIELEKRNATIIPIEGLLGIKKLEKGIASARRETDKVILLHKNGVQREKIYLNAIKSHLATKNPPAKAYVFGGASHAFPMQESLNSNGFKTTINFDIYGPQIIEDVKKYTELEHRARRAFVSGEHGKVINLHSRLSEVWTRITKHKTISGTGVFKTWDKIQKRRQVILERQTRAKNKRLPHHLS